tara:strand:+ start:1354 stop:2517 length:1164 start_codon:yes stop_codon:yes gene_type:complete
MASDCDLKPVVVAGGGFGGLTVAIKLSSLKSRFRIILIDPKSRFVFLPFLYELLSGELARWEIAPLYKNILSERGIVFIKDSVQCVNVKDQTIQTLSGKAIKYSQLVIATGSIPNDLDIRGLRENALTFSSLQDVEKLKNLISTISKLSSLDRKFIIIGAGTSGVELASKIADFTNKLFEINIIESGNCILPNSKSFNRDQAENILKEKDVKVILNTKVLSVDKSKIYLRNTSNLSRDFSLEHIAIIFTAGTTVRPPIFDQKDILAGQRLVVDNSLRLIGCKNVWSLGDVSIGENHKWPSTAQVAMQQAICVAENIMKSRIGRPQNTFDFVDNGEFLSLGIGSASITSRGLTISGTAAFRLRRFFYLFRMPILSLAFKSARAWLLDN